MSAQDVNTKTARDVRRLIQVSGGDPFHTPSGRRRQVQCDPRMGAQSRDPWTSSWTHGSGRPTALARPVGSGGVSGGSPHSGGSSHTGGSGKHRKRDGSSGRFCK
jgi:hypothetical protein